MRLLEHEMPDDFNLFLFGDVHKGTILHYHKGFEQFLDAMQSPYEDLPATRNFAVDHGDAIEAITVDDKRYDARLVEDPRGTPHVQADDYVAMLAPIRKQVLCRLSGNHELYLKKFGDLAEYISNRLEVPHGTYTAKITYKGRDGYTMFKHFATHGRKMISSVADDPLRREAGMQLTLKRHLKFKAGDAVLQTKGHCHRLLVCKPTAELYLVDNGEEIEQRYSSSRPDDGFIHPDHRFYASCGSFYRLYADNESGYAECAEYDPLELGYCVALVRDREIQDVKRVILGGA
jgi:hypothetical protein